MEDDGIPEEMLDDSAANLGSIFFTQLTIFSLTNHSYR